MANTATHPLDAFFAQAADFLADRISAVLAAALPKAGRTGNTRAPGGLSANEKRRRAMKGRKLDMSCRVAGCKERSGGPAKGYMCGEHQKLPKKQQQAARDAWKAKHAA